MWGGTFEENKVADKIKTINYEIAKENFWKDKLLAQKTLKEKSFYDNILKNYTSTINELENLEQLLELATQENDLIGFTGYRTAANSVWLRDTGNHMLVRADVDSDRRYDF